LIMSLMNLIVMMMRCRELLYSHNKIQDYGYGIHGNSEARIPLVIR